MILVDYRAGSCELLNPLRALGLTAESGDFMADLAWEGRGIGGAPVMIGVEFKRLSELVQSLRTQRLQGHQLLQMRDNFTFCYLLVEGVLRTDRDGYLLMRRGNRSVRMPGTMRAVELLKRLFVLHLRGGLNILPFTGSRQETLQMIKALYHTWTDCDLDQHKSHIAIYQAPTLVPISEFRGLMTRIDGIGLVTSRAIERYFGGSIRRAVNAPITEWMKIDGIGAVLAAHIQRTFKESDMTR